MVTSLGRPCSAVKRYATSSCSNSLSRPTKCRRSPWIPRGRINESARMSRRQGTPPRLPFASTIMASVNSNAPRDAATVRSPTRISPGPAACSRRAATLTASPVHERASFARAADHDVAGVHADPEDELLAEHRFELPAHGQRGMQGSLGMVLVCGGRAEGRHDRVSGKLLDRTSGSHDLLRHGLIEALEHGPGPLGILGSPELSGADEVGEEHRCNLALVDGPSLNDTGLLVNPCRQP